MRYSIVSLIYRPSASDYRPFEHQIDLTNRMVGNIENGQPVLISSRQGKTETYGKYKDRRVVSERDGFYLVSEPSDTFLGSDAIDYDLYVPENSPYYNAYLVCREEQRYRQLKDKVEDYFYDLFFELKNNTRLSRELW